MSLDGYIEDAHGAWTPPDDDVFAAYNALLRSVGSFRYGWRLYETMAAWETNPAIAEHPDLTAHVASASGRPTGPSRLASSTSASCSSGP